MKIQLIPVSKKLFDSKEMQIVINQSKVSARRIKKKNDVGLERKRFTNACNRMQELAIQENNDKILTLEKDIGKSIIEQVLNENKIQYPFLEIKKIKDFINIKNFNILELAGVVCFIDSFNGSIEFPTNKSQNALKKQIAVTSDYSNYEIDFKKFDEVEKKFAQQIKHSIENNIPVGWINIESNNYSTSLVRHETLIKILHNYIYIKKQKNKIILRNLGLISILILIIATIIWYFKPILIFILAFIGICGMIFKKKLKIRQPKPVNLHFAYQDGSVGGHFPIFSLFKSQEPNKLSIIKVALISGRHFELDSEIDICLIRNSEISRREEASIAEQEHLAYEIAKKFFDKILKKGGLGTEIHLYHTGLEPAVIGTYRAILDTLQNSKFRGKFKVIPKMFRGKNRFEDLKAWY